MMARGEFHWVFALSNEGLSTPAVYNEFDVINPEAPAPVVAPALIAAIAAGEVRTAAKHLENDLQVPAIRLRHSLNATLRAGREAGALAALVSGSGPTCAFLSRDADHAVELAIELQASGAVHRTVRASGPVRGAHVVSVD
jgi:4-diphosphocytidyl-2-C-methyl-D-erythritol kinase